MLVPEGLFGLPWCVVGGVSGRGGVGGAHDEPTATRVEAHTAKDARVLPLPVHTQGRGGEEGS